MPTQPNEFERAMVPLLVIEGGKVDDKNDPGGRTNQGVTQKVYSAWRKNSKLPSRDVYAMTPSERDAIYRAQYWDRIQGDKLPAGIGYVVFDGAVHSGVSQSIKWLQRALAPLYKGAIDGQIGQLTLDAINAVNDHDSLIAKILDRRLAFLQALKTWKFYARGWDRRIKDALARGQAWAAGSVGPTPVYIPSAERKANLEDAKVALPRAPGDLAAAGGGTIGIGVGPLLEQAKTELAPLAAKLAYVNSIIFWLTAAGLILAAAGIAYRFYAANQKKQLDDALDAEVV